MDIEKLVVIINSELAKNNKISVNKIIDKLGLKQSTVKGKLRKAGYTFNVDLRQYVLEDKSNVRQVVTTREAEPLEVVEVLSQTASQNVTELELLKKYQGLFNKYDIIMKMVENYEVTTSKNVTDNVLTIELPYEAKADTRATFRINDTVYREFKAFAESHKQFTVKELISQALIEFMDKYK